MAKRCVVPMHELKAFTSALEAIGEQSDLNYVIMASAMLENAFGSLLQKSFVSEIGKLGDEVLNDPGRPLASYSARADLCRCFGLISKKAHNQAKRIARIRNIFAHRVEPVDFTHAEVVKECDGFESVELVVDRAEGESWPESLFVEPKSHPRRLMFAVAVREVFAEIYLNFHAIRPAVEVSRVFYLMIESIDPPKFVPKLLERFTDSPVA